MFELEERAGDARAAILEVSNEITEVTRAPVRIPTMDDEALVEPNAHHATINLARGLLEALLDCLLPPWEMLSAAEEPTPLRNRAAELELAWPEAARAITMSVWPDWGHLRELLIVEAASVAHQRRRSRAPGQTAVGTATAGDCLDLPDGPVPPHRLRWRGELVRIGSSRAQLPWRLLNFFWERSSATFEELQGAGGPWPDPVRESAIASAINRFNTALPADFPWRLATKAYWVFKESRENPLV